MTRTSITKELKATVTQARKNLTGSKKAVATLQKEVLLTPSDIECCRAYRSAVKELINAARELEKSSARLGKRS